VIEQESAFGLDRWAGTAGEIVAMRTFGSSAPLKALQTKFGFTLERIVQAAKTQLDLTS
jgi:transketolase